MTLVKPKAEPREAWQYVPLAGAEWPAWVMNCTSIRAIDGEGCLFLKRRSGDQQVAPFDWIIRNLDGEPEWLTHEQMRKTFDEVVG